MRISELQNKPISRVRYLNAGRRGKAETAQLPVLLAKGDLPASLDALICTSDLQGVVPSYNGPNRLLGVHLVDALLELSEVGDLPYPERTGVILAGDLYSAPGGNVRGASGDVREVWTAFGEHYAWVVGVQGNHDRFGTPAERRSLEANFGLLDAAMVERDGLRIAGVGEVIGNAAKPGRRSAGDFLTSLDLALESVPDILVMHEGPNGEAGQRGNELVGERLRDRRGLTVCGHVHWEQPLHDQPSGGQVLNVDSRVVVILSDG